MNMLEIPRALDGIAPIGVSGQRHNVEQGGICHGLHSLTIWASNLDKVTQRSRADRTAPSESRAGLSGTPGKAKCPFQERIPWLSLAQVEGMSGADLSPQHRLSTQQKEPRGNRVWSRAGSRSPSRSPGSVCIPQPPPLPPSEQLSGNKSIQKRQKAWKQGGDALLLIATVPTHGCQEPDRGAPYLALG